LQCISILFSPNFFLLSAISLRILFFIGACGCRSESGHHSMGFSLFGFIPGRKHSGHAACSLAGDYIGINGVLFTMQNIKKILFTFSAIAVVAIISNSAFAQSCPMCKESMTAAGAKLSEGFYYSIISMFSLPVTMIGAGTLFVAMNSWRRNHPEAENFSTWQVVKAMAKERRGR